MPTIIKSFLQPTHWQVFEKMTKEIARYKLSGDFENYGREGQKQDGVDVSGWDRDYRPIGVQCKHKKASKSRLKAKIITEISTDIIDAEIGNADNFHIKLEKFIIATTNYRDTKYQKHVNAINQQRKKDNKFTVDVWFWDDFEEEFNRHTELIYIYYEDVLKALNIYDKDKHIVALLFHSLSRPAFSTPFNSENNCSDFIKAISDTQRAFINGKLYDREGNLITSSFPANRLSKSEDRHIVTAIIAELQNIRDYTTDLLKTGEIQQDTDYLNIPNDFRLGISDKLNQMRKKILIEFNNIAKSTGTAEINSKLLQ